MNVSCYLVVCHLNCYSVINCPTNKPSTSMPITFFTLFKSVTTKDDSSQERRLKSGYSLIPLCLRTEIFWWCYYFMPDCACLLFLNLLSLISAKNNLSQKSIQDSTQRVRRNFCRMMYEVLTFQVMMWSLLSAGELRREKEPSAGAHSPQ